MNTEEHARQEIDRLLAAAGWAVQGVKGADPTAARGVALRELELNPGQGTADYLLYVDGKAAGIVEAKKQGATLTGVEVQFAEAFPEGAIVATLWRQSSWSQFRELLPLKRPLQRRRAGAASRKGFR